MIRLPKQLVVILLLLPLLLISLCFAEDYYSVRRVVDGDTLLLDNGERVRLIGVDTPEVHPSKKLQRDAQRSRRNIETIRELGRKVSAFG